MDVIPLTLAISLLLSLTFIALFVREFSRPRRAGSDRESLLPFEPEQAFAAAPRPAQPAPHVHHAHGQEHGHGHDEVCASKRSDGKCCSSCQRRKDRAAAKSPASAASAAGSAAVPSA